MNLDFSTYLLALLTSTVFGYIFGWVSSPAMYHLQVNLRRIIKIKKYHLHHDLGGLLVIAISQISPSVWVRILFTGFGFGLFVHHITTDGFKFITKNN